MLLRQFFDAATASYTYLVGTTGREAALIDPVREQVPQYLTAIEQLRLRLVYALDTHTHADHVTGLGELRDATACTTIMGEFTRAECVSRRVRDGESIAVDDVILQAVYTPGHTDESFSYVLRPARPYCVFTGDVLLIRGTGRTDFQNGDPAKSWDSIVNRLFPLPEETLVYPAHDYRGWTVSTIGEEKAFNPRLAGRTREEYIALMRALKLPNPRLMDVAVPANLACGQTA